MHILDACKKHFCSQWKGKDSTDEKYENFYHKKYEIKATTIPKIYFKNFHKVLKYDKIMKIMNESQDSKLTRNENWGFS